VDVHAFAGLRFILPIVGGCIPGGKAPVGGAAIMIYDGRMALDPKSLRLFTRVGGARNHCCGCGRASIIAAAAVSKRLADLEAQLGTPLLLRTNKGYRTHGIGDGSS